MISPKQADAALLASMESMVSGNQQLTGLTVCYGNREESHILSTGSSREVLWADGGFIPARKAITPDTIYDIASLTKLFTLVSVLQLWELGTLRMEDSIRHLDARFTRLGDCSLGACLDYSACLRTPQRIDTQESPELARGMVFQTGVSRPEGERLYSDMNALVLKYVVEAVTGLDFMAYVKARILQPAGMANTWADIPEGRLKDVMDYNYEHKVVNGSYTIDRNALPGLPHDPKARLLKRAGDGLSGHAGLFSTAKDLCLLSQALLRGSLVRENTLLSIGINRTGYLLQDGAYRQFLGLLCFSKSPIQRLSEVPGWMGLRAFGLSGYTGNHLALDPEAGVFDLMLGNRCHNRVSLVAPESDARLLELNEDGTGSISWPDGRRVMSSFQFIHQKDAKVHRYTRDCLLARGWL